MSKKLKKIITAGLLGAVALSTTSLADIPNIETNNLNQEITKVNHEVLTALSSYNKGRSPWKNGNFFANGFANGSWGRSI